MNLIESLEWRYATKKMNGEKIPQDKLDRILQATKLAPIVVKLVLHGMEVKLLRDAISYIILLLLTELMNPAIALKRKLYLNITQPG